MLPTLPRDTGDNTSLDNFLKFGTLKRKRFSDNNSAEGDDTMYTEFLTEFS